MPTDDPSPALRPPEAAPFPYLRWAKAHLAWEAAQPGSRNLGMSGCRPLDDGERTARGLAPLPGVGASAAALKAALAEPQGLTPAHVHLTAGTSHANFIAYLALARGGHVAVETPAYEALHVLADAVGATRRTFRRDPARGWRLDPASLAAAVDDRTDLIVLTDLHNPSGMRLHPDDLEAVLELARTHDALVLVDEVYLDFDPERRPSAATRDERILVTNSLTKAHGLPDLRAGWILGAPEVVARIDAWDDLVHPGQPTLPVADAARFVPQAAARMPAIRAEAAARSAQVDAWVEATPGVSWVRPHGGLTGFLRLDGIDGDAVADHAWAHDGVRVVPGRFFQEHEALRISYLLPEAELASALDVLARAVDACA